MDKHHILVVDDNHINRLFFESSLKKLGTMVSTAENGYQAVEMCLTEKFNLILMDIRMNGMDGIETAAEIKAIEQHANTPILAVSAEQFNCNSHPDFVTSLLKPISQSQLKTMIDIYVNQTVSFDHEQALKISHDDQQIVEKLRFMLIQQLPNDEEIIETHYQAQEWEKLDQHLHKMLGSAKVCAATLLISSIKTLKSKLKRQENISEDYRKLKTAIKTTLTTI